MVLCIPELLSGYLFQSLSEILAMALDNLGKYCHITLLKIHVFFLSSCRKAKGSMDLLFCQVFKILRDGCERKSEISLTKGLTNQKRGVILRNTTSRRDGRVDEGATLEMWCGATHRGFESLSLRHFFYPPFNLPEKIILVIIL